MLGGRTGGAYFGWIMLPPNSLLCSPVFFRSHYVVTDESEHRPMGCPIDRRLNLPSRRRLVTLFAPGAFTFSRGPRRGLAHDDLHSCVSVLSSRALHLWEIVAVTYKHLALNAVSV